MLVTWGKLYVLVKLPDIIIVSVVWTPGWNASSSQITLFPPPAAFCQFAITVPQCPCIHNDLGWHTNLDHLTIRALCLLLCDKLLCLLYQMVFTNNNKTSLEGIRAAWVDVHMGTLVCTTAVVEETLGESEVITEGLLGQVIMVSIVCISSSWW